MPCHRSRALRLTFGGVRESASCALTAHVLELIVRVRPVPDVMGRARRIRLLIALLVRGMAFAQQSPVAARQLTVITVPKPGDLHGST